VSSHLLLSWLLPSPSQLHSADGYRTYHLQEAAAFLAPLPPRALPGVGQRTSAQLEQLGVTTVAQLRELPLPALAIYTGRKAAQAIHAAAWGRDVKAVEETRACKSVSVEDSFRSCTSFTAADAVLRVLAPDLVARLVQVWWCWVAGV
jgi:nucleotidyltransferase/DNA polymerase involved in DNA repair